MNDIERAIYFITIVILIGLSVFSFNIATTMTEKKSNKEIAQLQENLVFYQNEINLLREGRKEHLQVMLKLQSYERRLGLPVTKIHFGDSKGFVGE